jgi:hypothetical protein
MADLHIVLGVLFLNLLVPSLSCYRWPLTQTNAGDEKRSDSESYAADHISYSLTPYTPLLLETRRNRRHTPRRLHPKSAICNASCCRSRLLTKSIQPDQPPPRTKGIRNRWPLCLRRSVCLTLSGLPDYELLLKSYSIGGTGRSAQVVSARKL